jgi:hypothetical protein
MGLDMYLSATEYVSRYDYTPDYDRSTNALFGEIVKQFDVENSIDESGFAGISIDFPMGYWRKANQIHAWFVNNVQDGEDNCGTYYVSREKLEELKELCEQVIADNSLAMELLPPQMGFFFGSYDIDQYYLEDLRNTVSIIDRCLSSKFSSFQYQSSW